MKPLPNQNLRLGVLPMDAGHAIAALGGIESVGHGAKIGILWSHTLSFPVTFVTWNRHLMTQRGRADVQAEVRFGQVDESGRPEGRKASRKERRKASRKAATK
jgi:hypothetical protein